MSVLPPGVYDTLGQLLQTLQSTNNTIRSAAEQQLNDDWTYSRPDVTLMGLVEHMQGSSDSSVKCLMGHAPSPTDDALASILCSSDFSKTGWKISKD